MNQALAPFSDTPQGLNPHATAAEMRRYFATHHPAWNDYYWFAIVRHPFAQLVSLWKFIAGNPRHPDHSVIANMDFAAFIDWLEQTGWARWDVNEDRARKVPGVLPRYIRQVDFLCDDAGQLLVDRVLKLEQISAQWSALEQDLAFSASLPHVNRTSHKHYSDYICDRVAEQIHQHYRADFECFNYLPR